MKVRTRNILISILVFVIGISGDFILTGILHKRYVDTLKTRSKLHAQIYGNAMKNQIVRANDLTRLIQYAVIAGNGNVEDFDHIAKKWINNNKYVLNVELAPKGVITHVYPKKSYVKGKIDLLNDSDSAALCKYSIKNDSTTIQGPFKLKQGGYGYALRNPVMFIKNGKKTFWGFAIVIIDADKMIAHYSDSLLALHYRLNLYQKNIYDRKYKIIGGEKTKLAEVSTYQFSFSHCNWKLCVVPENGYVVSESVRMIYILFFSVILLLSYLIYIMLMKQEQQKKDRKQAITDYLTGLLNRNGFDESVKGYLKIHKNVEACMIMLDIDDFKFVNDLHGHRVGDLVLKNLAKRLVDEFGSDSIIGRNGGDEFCVFIKHIQINQLVSRLDKFAAQTYRVYDQEQMIHYTISLGYALYPSQAQEFKSLIMRADASLYFMKLNQKKGAAQYQDGMLEIKRERLGFNLKNIALHLPGAFIIYSLKENGRILFANNEMIQIMGCANDEEFLEYSHNSVFSLVEDRERVEKELCDQLYDKHNNKETRLSFHVISKDGKRLYIHERARLVYNDFFGDIVYATLISKQEQE